ncbi:hypothetical protein Tco_0554356 [Tanacetum coccineum]
MSLIASCPAGPHGLQPSDKLQCRPQSRDLLQQIQSVSADSEAGIQEIRNHRKSQALFSPRSPGFPVRRVRVRFHSALHIPHIQSQSPPHNIPKFKSLEIQIFELQLIPLTEIQDHYRAQTQYSSPRNLQASSPRETRTRKGSNQFHFRMSYYRD